jgi:hypothetical protein
MRTALLLSRLQFAFTVSFHIICPSFTIGFAAWLTVLETFHLVTGKPVYRRVFEFWLRIFGMTFGLGVVSGIVLAFEFGMNWSRLSEVTGPIQGPLLELHGICPGGLVLRRADLRAKPGTAAGVPVFNHDGGAWHDFQRLLDHGEQQLDAGPGRLRD